MNKVETTKKMGVVLNWVRVLPVVWIISTATVVAQGTLDPGGDLEPQILVGSLPSDALVDHAGIVDDAVPHGAGGVLITISDSEYYHLKEPKLELVYMGN